MWAGYWIEPYQSYAALGPQYATLDSCGPKRKEKKMLRPAGHQLKEFNKEDPTLLFIPALSERKLMAASEILIESKGHFGQVLLFLLSSRQWQIKL